MNMKKIVIFTAILCSLNVAFADYKECMDNGNSLLDRGNYQEAIDAFDLALKYDPQYVDAQRMKAKVKELVLEKSKKK